jgi:hypothetical protein
MFWVPRDCPRGCIWPVSATTRKDRELFFGQSAATRIHVIENGWLRRMQECRLHAYRLPAGPFRPHEVGGYWVADEPVDAVEQVVIDDLGGRHARAGIGRTFLRPKEVRVSSGREVTAIARPQPRRERSGRNPHSAFRQKESVTVRSVKGVLICPNGP